MGKRKKNKENNSRKSLPRFRLRVRGSVIHSDTALLFIALYNTFGFHVNLFLVKSKTNSAACVVPPYRIALVSVSVSVGPDVETLWPDERRRQYS